MRDTIDMAREAGSQEYGPLTRNWSFELAQLKAFEDLVRADEREACAKVADEYANGLERNYSENIADAIRARGDVK
jgi:hypothetical protein